MGFWDAFTRQVGPSMRQAGGQWLRQKAQDDRDARRITREDELLAARHKREDALPNAIASMLTGEMPEGGQVKEGFTSPHAGIAGAVLGENVGPGSDAGAMGELDPNIRNRAGMAVDDIMRQREKDEYDLASKKQSDARAREKYEYEKRQRSVVEHQQAFGNALALGGRAGLGKLYEDGWLTEEQYNRRIKQIEDAEGIKDMQKEIAAMNLDEARNKVKGIYRLDPSSAANLRSQILSNRKTIYELEAMYRSVQEGGAKYFGRGQTEESQVEMFRLGELIQTAKDNIAAIEADLSGAGAPATGGGGGDSELEKFLQKASGEAPDMPSVTPEAAAILQIPSFFGNTENLNETERRQQAAAAARGRPTSNPVTRFMDEMDANKRRILERRGGQNPNVPAGASASAGEPRPNVPFAIDPTQDQPADAPPVEYASIPNRLLRPGVPLEMTDVQGLPVDVDVPSANLPIRRHRPMSRQRPGVTMCDILGIDAVEDMVVPDADLRLNQIRPSVPASMDSGGEALPEDVQLAYIDLGLHQMRPEVAFELADFDPQPMDYSVEESDLSIEPMAVRMLEETEEVVPKSVLSDGTSLVALDVLQKHSKPNGKVQVIIDLNTNTATVMRGQEFVTQYPIASGDIEGTSHKGNKKFTPSGETQVYTEEKYKTHKQAGRDDYGPYWMSLYDPAKAKAGQHFAGIGMHGPYYEKNKVFDEEGNFLNDGRLSAGCIRFKVDDLNDLAQHVKIGTRVYVMPLKGATDGTDSRTATASNTLADEASR